MTKNFILKIICNFKNNIYKKINIKKRNKIKLNFNKYMKYKKLIQLWIKLGKPF